MQSGRSSATLVELDNFNDNFAKPPKPQPKSRISLFTICFLK